MDMNNRYNSVRRVIESQTDLDVHRATLEWKDHEYILQQDDSRTTQFPESNRSIRTAWSLLQSVVLPHGNQVSFFGIGEDLIASKQVLFASQHQSSLVSIPAEKKLEIQIIPGSEAHYLSLVLGFLLSKYIASRLPLGTTAIVHETSPSLRHCISRALETLGCTNMIFTTSISDNTERPQKSLFIHPRIFDRELKTVLPKRCGLWLDMSAMLPAASDKQASATLSRRISKLLPELCGRYDISTIMANLATDVNEDHESATIQALLVQSSDFAEKHLHETLGERPLPTRALSEILAHKDGCPILGTVVSWRSGSNTLAPVRVKPVFTRNDLFSPDKTYWLVGLAGDLGRSLCDFMIERGAKYIVLSSRNPQADDECVTIRSHNGSTWETPPR